MICPDIIFVCRSKSNGTLGVKLEGSASDHLQIQLFLSEGPQTSRKTRNTHGTYLIIIVEFLKVTFSDEIPHDLII